MVLESLNPPSSQPPPPRGPSFLHSVGALVLRVGVGIFVAFHLTFPQLIAGWKYVWDKKPWPLVTAMSDSGFPFSNILAPAIVVIVFLCGIALLVGFLGSGPFTSLSAPIGPPPKSRSRLGPTP